jgi:hypothetical protein
MSLLYLYEISGLPSNPSPSLLPLDGTELVWPFICPRSCVTGVLVLSSCIHTLGKKLSYSLLYDSQLSTLMSYVVVDTYIVVDTSVVCRCRH